MGKVEGVTLLLAKSGEATSANKTYVDQRFFSEGGISAGGVTLGVGGVVGSIGVCANITFVSIQSIRGLC